MDLERLISVAEVCRLLGCHVETWRRWRRQGLTPPETKTGFVRKIMYKSSDVRKWMDQTGRVATVQDSD